MFNVIRDIKYQIDAADAMAEFSKNILESNQEFPYCPAIKFRAPTGGGKTFIVARTIDTINSSVNVPVVYFWISIGKGKLQNQSHSALTEYFLNKSTNVELLNPNFYELNPNGIFVFNWEKVSTQKGNDWTNILMRDSENGNLPQLCEDARRKGLKMVVLVDEDHLNKTIKTTTIINEILQPSLIYKISATELDVRIFSKGKENIDSLKMKELKIFMEMKIRETEGGLLVIDIPEKEVVDAGMIKKEFIVNEEEWIIKAKDEISKRQIPASENAVYIVAGTLKRQHLELLHRKENSDVNSVNIIQLPNADKGKIVMQEVLDIQKEFGNTIENGKVGVWLSNERENIDDNNKLNAGVRHLLFKSAVATGWDNPPNAIWTKLRDMSSEETFDIQTGGRIRRMPERKHYEIEELNNAYIFCSDKRFIESTRLFSNVKQQFTSKRSEFVPITLQKEVIKRQYTRNLVAEEFYPLLAEQLNSLGTNQKELFNNGVDFDKSFYTNDNIIANIRISNSVVDESQKREIEFNRGNNNLAVDLEIKHNILRDISFDNTTSIKNIREGIYNWFKRTLEFDRSQMSDVRRIFMMNIEIFKPKILKAIEVYEKDYGIIIEPINWQPKNSLSFSMATSKEESQNKNYYERYYTKSNRSMPEAMFERDLETNINITPKIEWWLKNGDSGYEHFCVAYTDKFGKVRNFFPDYIIQTQTNKICIVDTKSGRTAEDAKEKAEALQRWADGQDIIAGIIVEDKNRQWRLNREKTYEYDENKISSWELLEDLFV